MVKMRNLKANEIELKPCQVAKDNSWVQLLCYKTSRVDMQILTETFGMGWKSEYKMIGDSLFCTLSVRDDNGEWISRTDCGEKNEGGICEEKSYATSAFKRAATQFGIGINLYSSPTIFITLNDRDLTRDGKLKSKRFYVSDIDYDENGEITNLIVRDNDGAIRWSTQKENVENSPVSEPSEGNSYLERLREFVRGRIKKEPEWKEDIIKFGKTYAKLLPEWKGIFLVEKCYKKWVANRRVA